MNIKGIAIAAILFISTPIISEVMINNRVMAQTYSYPQGYFSDGVWLITLRINYGAYYNYTGEYLPKGSILHINSNPSISRQGIREIYTWRKNNHLYRITYRRNDPNFIRLEVISPTGKRLVNSLLRGF